MFINFKLDFDIFEKDLIYVFKDIYLCKIEYFCYE